LSKKGISVFYDHYEEVELWGKNLFDHLTWVYKDAAQYCIMLISESYVRKVWTRMERRSAQSRALIQESEYILPIKLDDAEAPGVLDSIGYIDARKRTIEDIANLIIQKLTA
jgi:hypothetical protein